MITKSLKKDLREFFDGCLKFQFKNTWEETLTLCEEVLAERKASKKLYEQSLSQSYREALMSGFEGNMIEYRKKVGE